MSTDKTLADVQPGGRVRLGDQAERAQWRSMDTCPRDGTVVRLRWGEDHVSPGWWSAPVSPVQNDDGTWPSDTGGFPWAFIDFNNGSAFVNHAVDTEYGPTHWAPYAALSAQPSPGGQGDARIPFETWAKSQNYDMHRSAGGPTFLVGEYTSELTAGAWEAWQYLAARQPVGEAFHVNAVEPCGKILYVHPAGVEVGDTLYAAPPAQADQEYLESLDRALEGVIDERDRYHEMADDLAGHIAAITGVDIGEHSSDNCPWQNAIEAAEEYKPAQAVDLGQFRDSVMIHRMHALVRFKETGDEGHNAVAADCDRLLALIDSQDSRNG